MERTAHRAWRFGSDCGVCPSRDRQIDAWNDYPVVRDSRRAAAVCVAYCTGRQVSKSSNAPSKSGNLWKIDTAWNSRDPKPDFNDMVEYQGVVYGFDASIFGCISLETGKRLWKKGRYGTGQVVGNRVYARNSQEAACFTFATH